MTDIFCRKNILFLRKIISVFILVAFFFSTITPAGAQILPAPGISVGLTAGFQPPVLLGLKIHPENPLLFDFIIDQGAAKLSSEELKSETEKLVKYFLAALTIPDKESWVNLSPYEKDRIIPDALGQTAMGKTMLEQDYLLKQLASSLTNPDEKLGQEFWSTVKNQVWAKLNTVDVPMNTFNKVWIVPAKAEVLESEGIVLVGQKRLRIMMDQDYLALEKNDQGQNPQARDVSTISSQVFKETILPNIEKEINEGKNFADVRQIYNSVILAAWYKKALKDSLLGKVYADKSKIMGVESGDKEMKQRIYEQYLAAFKKGVYNLIKEDPDPATGDVIPRKYFSGGIEIANFSASSSLEGKTILLLAAGRYIADGNSPVWARVGLTEPETPEGQAVASAGVSVATASGPISVSSISGKDRVNELLKLFKKRGITQQMLSDYFGYQLSQILNGQIGENEIRAYVVKRQIMEVSQVNDVLALTEITQSLNQWILDGENRLQLGNSFAGTLPWVLAAVYEELGHPRGLQTHSLVNGAELFIPLFGNNINTIRTVSGNTQVVADTENVGGSTRYYQGPVQEGTRAGKVVGTRQTAFVGTQPAAPSDGISFPLDNTDSTVAKLHYTSQYVIIAGRPYLRVTDSNSGLGTLVLTDGIKEVSHVMAAPETIVLGKKAKATEATVDFFEGFQLEAGDYIYHFKMIENGQFTIQGRHKEHPERLTAVEKGQLGLTYKMGRTMEDLTGGVDISTEGIFHFPENRGMTGYHLDFEIKEVGDHYQATVLDLNSSNQTFLTVRRLIPPVANNAVNSDGQTLAEAISDFQFLNSQSKQKLVTGLSWLIARDSLIAAPIENPLDNLRQEYKATAKAAQDKYDAMNLSELGEALQELRKTGTFNDQSGFPPSGAAWDSVQNLLDTLTGKQPYFPNPNYNRLDTVLNSLIQSLQIIRPDSDSFRDRLYIMLPKQREELKTSIELKAALGAIAENSGIDEPFLQRLSASSTISMKDQFNQAIANFVPVDEEKGKSLGIELFIKTVLNPSKNQQSYLMRLYLKDSDIYTAIRLVVNNKDVQGFRIVKGNLIENDEWTEVNKIYKAASNSQSNISANDNSSSGSAASSSLSQMAPGGIDFDPTNMNLQIKRNGRGVPLPLPQQNLEQINIKGLVPVIINMVPVNAQTLPIFLGQAPKEPADDRKLASSAG